MAFAADVKAAVGNRGGGADRFAQLVACQEPKGRLRGQHVNVARGTRGIDLAPELLASLDIVAGHGGAENQRSA